jgi:hypothetical protein
VKARKPAIAADPGPSPIARHPIAPHRIQPAVQGMNRRFR